MFIEITEYIKKDKTERQKHLDLSQECWIRGGNSTNHKGVLAQYLNTTIPSGRILLCHACGNRDCSNPKHLYWGTDRENIVEDGSKFNTWKPTNQRMIEKYGLEGYRKILSDNAKGNKSGAGNKGKSKSEEHKKKISEAITEKYKRRLTS